MGFTIHLGVIDMMYSDGPSSPPVSSSGKPRKGVSKRVGGGHQVKSTGDVAQILEAKYHLFTIFAEENMDKIADEVTNSYAGALESVAMGAPATIDPSGTAMSNITAMMKEFISSGAMEKLGYPGVPTQAALRGVSHRLKHPNAKGNPPRVSFRDTGLMQSSMLAWTTGA